MKASFNIQDGVFTVDLSKPIDLSIPLTANNDNPIAWYLGPPKITPVQLEDWVGSVKQGASVNFNNIYFNPHSHGTHTECVGHISEEFHSVNKALNTYFYVAEVISVVPEKVGEDQIITATQIKRLITANNIEALIIRTLPNTPLKKAQKYSHTNWPYLTQEAALYLRDRAIDHLLIDLPSVDKEKDEGALFAHKAFWNYPENPRLGATITEFIYVPDEVEDGRYVLNIQTAPFENDATPSRPVIYRIK